MALLRPCRRLIQAFSKLPIPRQVERTRRIERAIRIQGYVTVAPKPNSSITSSENLEVPNSDVSANEISSSLTNDLQCRLVSLCSKVKKGKINDREILRILEISVGAKYAMEESNLLILLRNCGNVLPSVKPADRRNLTNHIWELVSRDASKLTLKHYNTLLSIHAQNNQPVEPEMFLDDMTVKPDETTFRLLLNTAARCGDVESALYVLSRMKNEGYALNEALFNLLILAHGTAKDTKAALSTLESMKISRIEPSAETYANLACGYASVGDIHNMMKILNAHTLSDIQIMEIVKCLSGSELGKHIPDVLKYLASPSSINEALLTSTLMDLTHSGRPEDAFQLINLLTSPASPDETNSVFNGFFKFIVRAEIPIATTLKFMDTIMTAKNYPLAIMDVCEVALSSGQRELALTVLEVMHEKKIRVRPHYYWPLLIQAGRTHGEAEVLRTVKHMHCLNVVLDHDTLFSHILPYINTVDPLIALRKLGDLGLGISVIFSPLICHLLNQGKVKEAVSLCMKIKAPIAFDRVLKYLCRCYKSNRNLKDCVKMLTFAPPDKYYPEEFLLMLYGKAPSGEKARSLNEFLEAFKAAKIPVSNFATVEAPQADKVNEQSEVTLVNPLDLVRPYDRIPHPRDMSIEELECHLIELRAKGMNQRGVMRKLLQVYCRENNMNRAEEIKREYDEKGFTWSPGMCSSLLELYVRNGRVQEAMKLYSQLQDYKDFRIDDFKVIHLATALVNANMISEAFTILESTTSIGGSRVSKDCWRLLDAMAHGSSPELTESMLEVLVNGGFCEKDNSKLGPIVRVHLLRNDLVSAVETFARCAEMYGHTPLRRELVQALVKSINTNDGDKTENMKLLEQVQSITTKIHGSDALTRTDLLVTLAELEMTDELRKFLQNNQVSDHILSQSLTLLSEDQKVSILTTILDATTDSSYISRTFIYEQILDVYSRSGDCEKAIELWKRLLAEDELVSRRFRRVFVGLLTKHKVPLPESLSGTRFDE